MVKEFYTEKEISKRLNITVQTLGKLRRNSQIDFIKVGRAIRYPAHVYNGKLKNIS